MTLYGMVYRRNHPISPWAGLGDKLAQWLGAGDRDGGTDTVVINVSMELYSVSHVADVGQMG